MQRDDDLPFEGRPASPSLPGVLSSAGARLRRSGAAGLVAVMVGAGLLAGCGTSETLTHGYVITPDALAQVPIGSSREQVLLALGTPSTTSTVGNGVFYYITQTTRRQMAFMMPKVIDQRVVAIYFDEQGHVKQIADYGLKDGKVFDFYAQKTPTGGTDFGFIGQVIHGSSTIGPSIGK